MTAAEFLILFLAAAGAGAVNAIAGGGTLVSFPVLLALGVPPIAANVTNAVALCPGYFGATLTQWHQVRNQHLRLRHVLPAAVIGGLLGATILLHTQDRIFAALVPYMLCVGALLLAIQEWVRGFAVRRAAEHHPGRIALAFVAVLGAGIYGGFFSAGMSVVLLAVLALTLDDTFVRLNALKQVAAFAVNVAATVFFLFSDQVVWPAAAVMAVGALIGGGIGGHFAGRMHPTLLRWTVVCVGFGLAIYYWIEG
jgi:uncharacterized membrane protein YfcA